MVGFATIRPPKLNCTNASCADQGKRLGTLLDYSATLFTFDHGPIPVFPISLLCQGKFLYISEAA